MFVDARYTLVEGGPARQGTQAAKDGSFRLELPERAQWQGPLSLIVSGPSGAVVGTLNDVPGVTFTDLEIEVDKDVDPAIVLPSSDPTLGTFARFSGRVIDKKGNPQKAGLLVVLFGVAPASNDPYPLTVAETAVGATSRANGERRARERVGARLRRHAGRHPLDGDRLPRRFVVVMTRRPRRRSDKPRPARPARRSSPRARGVLERRRLLRDVRPRIARSRRSFHAVVRTTQPEVRGTTGRPSGRADGADRQDSRCSRARGRGSWTPCTSPRPKRRRRRRAPRPRHERRRHARGEPHGRHLSHDRALARRARCVDELRRPRGLDPRRARRPPIRSGSNRACWLIWRARPPSSRPRGSSWPSARAWCATSAARWTLCSARAGALDLGADHQADWTTFPTLQATTVAQGIFLR